MPDDAQQPQSPPVAGGNRPVPVVYANVTLANGGLFDLSLDFGYGTGGQPFQPDVRVVLSWEQVAAVNHLLGGMLERYENDFGKVRRIDADTIKKIQEIQGGEQ